MKRTNSLKITKVTQDEIGNLNISITIKDIAFIVKSQKGISCPRCFSLHTVLFHFYHIFKKTKNYSDREKKSGCQGLVSDEGRVGSRTTKEQHEGTFWGYGTVLYSVRESIHVLKWTVHTKKVNFTVCSLKIFFLYNQDSLGKWLIPDLGHRRYKTSLEHLVML